MRAHDLDWTTVPWGFASTKPICEPWKVWPSLNKLISCAGPQDGIEREREPDQSFLLGLDWWITTIHSWSWCVCVWQCVCVWGIGWILLMHLVCILMRFMGAAQGFTVSCALLFEATMASYGGTGACLSNSVWGVSANSWTLQFLVFCVCFS